MKPTDTEEFFAELNAGVFQQKLSAELSEVATAVINNGKKGKVCLTLDFKPVGDSSQVSISHTIKTSKPTKRGSIVQDDTTDSVMYVNKGGNMTVAPEEQGKLFGLDCKITSISDRKGGE